MEELVDVVDDFIDDVNNDLEGGNQDEGDGRV